MWSWMMLTVLELHFLKPQAFMQRLINALMASEPHVHSWDNLMLLHLKCLLISKLNSLPERTLCTPHAPSWQCNSSDVQALWDKGGRLRNVLLDRSVHLEPPTLTSVHDFYQALLALVVLETFATQGPLKLWPIRQLKKPISMKATSRHRLQMVLWIFTAEVQHATALVLHEVTLHCWLSFQHPMTLLAVVKDFFFPFIPRALITFLIFWTCTFDHLLAINPSGVPLMLVFSTIGTKVSNVRDGIPKGFVGSKCLSPRSCITSASSNSPSERTSWTGHSWTTDTAFSSTISATGVVIATDVGRL